jgi:hypothetical protein
LLEHMFLTQEPHFLIFLETALQLIVEALHDGVSFEQFRKLANSANKYAP